jgi:LacI family repressor for deo operon, udp, cdd, tsx, nupC, and nupG
MDRLVPPTIHDVAARCGVSISTVSRALSRPERVNAGTREQVLAAADELGYEPSARARSLLTGRSMSFVLLVPDITNPFFFGLIRGTQHQAAVAGYTQVLVDTEESPALESQHLATSVKAADGVVLAASRLPSDALAGAAARLPLVLINRSVAGVASVTIDTPSSFSQAVFHLVSLGHRSLVYVGGPRSSVSSAGRWRAANAAARRAGVRITRVGPFAPTREAGAAAADAAVHLGATGILAFNDLLALGILRRLRERGIDVPRQVSLVGCDDIFGADFCDPPLTTITAPIEEAGRRATDLLLEQLRPARPVPARLELLTASLTIRGSTGPLGAAGEATA